MTEPAVSSWLPWQLMLLVPKVASSDATNIQSSIVAEGEHYVLNGHKWWISGAIDPRCQICIFMGKTDLTASKYKQQVINGWINGQMDGLMDRWMD